MHHKANDIEFLKKVAEKTGTFFVQDKNDFFIVIWSPNIEIFKNNYLNGFHYYPPEIYPCCYVGTFNDKYTVVVCTEKLTLFSKEYFLNQNFDENTMIKDIINGVALCKKLVNEKRKKTIEKDFDDENNRK